MPFILEQLHVLILTDHYQAISRVFQNKVKM